MLKDDPLREPLSGGAGEEKKRQIDGGEVVESGLQDEERQEGRERQAERRGGRQQSSCTLS